MDIGGSPYHISWLLFVWGKLPKALILKSQFFVKMRLAFNPPPVGCYELAGLDPNRDIELGEILKDTKSRNPNIITVYKSMGHGIEDLVVDNLIYERAKQQGLGKSIIL